MVSPLELIAVAANGIAAPILIALVGSSGLLGAIVAFVKLGGDRDTAAVMRARGAADALEAALEATERERDYWKARFEVSHQQENELRAKVSERAPSRSVIPA